MRNGLTQPQCILLLIRYQPVSQCCVCMYVRMFVHLLIHNCVQRSSAADTAYVPDDWLNVKKKVEKGHMCLFLSKIRYTNVLFEETVH